MVRCNMPRGTVPRRPLAHTCLHARTCPHSYTTTARGASVRSAFCAFLVSAAVALLLYTGAPLHSHARCARVHARHSVRCNVTRRCDATAPRRRAAIALQAMVLPLCTRTCWSFQLIRERPPAPAALSSLHNHTSGWSWWPRLPARLRPQCRLHKPAHVWPADHSLTAPLALSDPSHPRSAGLQGAVHERRPRGRVRVAGGAY